VAYVPPPPQQRVLAGQTLPRLEPTEVTAAQLALSAAEAQSEAQNPPAKGRKRAQTQPEITQVLTRNLLGCSPLLARELVYRVTENIATPIEVADEELWEELAWNVRNLTSAYDTHRWQPQLVEQADGIVPVAFASYALEQYAGDEQVRIRSLPSMNEILDDYYALAEWRDALEGVRAPTRKVLQTQRERCKRKVDFLQQELTSLQEAQQYRLQGDLLLAHQHDVQQGPVSVTLPNFFVDTGDGDVPVITIPLDPRFDAIGNANRLFHRYHKARRAAELLPGQIEQNNAELATIEQLMTDLVLAETPAEVTLVRSEVQEAGYLRGKKLPDKKARKMAKKGKGGKQQGKPALPGGGVPMHVQSREGFTILIGKNSRQNEEITFRQAVAHDLWLHARGVAGAHVIIKAAGREVPQATIEQAASLAAWYSEARGSTSVPVDYTLQRHVRHMKGGGPGMVIYERERTLYSTPRNSVD
jgi:predicted ribosome quality control (RQC) complex YloA/Tae2 family protein